MSLQLRVCLLGFGEVGQTLAVDLSVQGVELCAWDIQFANDMSGPRRAIDATTIRRATDARDAARDVNVVISAVTAAQDLAAAESIAPHLRPDTYFMDVNSVSPGVRKQVAELITMTEARYVEAAIMSPIAPRRIASPILLGGPQAAAFLPIAHSLGFSGTTQFSEEIGRASAAKMCRSVMVKGMEALLAESLVSARHYGVEDMVLESIRNLFPAENWPVLARYMISRSLVHGRRRAEEMREVAKTVREAGLTPSMSLACVDRQEWAAERADAAACEELVAMLDHLGTSSKTGGRDRC